ncbi:MAG TPA: hypothetical protein VHK90_16270 [Thermoanaerobaculia bacterium]|nr:hypothetical protein [Thermoanaerobaculia bacterium]
MSTSRRDFLVSAASAAAGLAVSRWAFAQATGCDYVKGVADNWGIVRPMLASRYHRLQHVLFHYVRNNWDMLSPAQQRDLASLKWNAPRPSMMRAKWDRRAGRKTVFWATANGSGIDFLFFHRWMITMVDQMFAAQGKPPIETWSDKDVIPAPRGGCPDEIVPPFTPRFEDEKTGAPIDIPSLQLRVEELKQPSFYWNRMNWWGGEYRDYAELRRTTLGALGSRLESGVHNQMHIRWSAYPSNGWTLIRNEPDFRTKWDDPGYDTLFDEYSSHVGPIFFRLHKWIDNRIEDWAEAQGSKVVRYRTQWGFDWFRSPEWVEVEQPWTGPWGMEHPSPDEEKRRIAIMEQATEILFRTEEAAALEAVSPEEKERRILTIRDLVM